MSFDIAIVGLACRFPGAAGPDEFWRNLCAGHESLRHFSDAELRGAGVADDQLAHPSYVRAGQQLADADRFDAAHFGITADDAEILDPQQRHFLECAHEALENAGYDPARFDGQIGVYAGAGLSTYLLHDLADRYRHAAAPERYRLMIANDKDFLATRVSYKLGLRGPSMSLNTACSTSLVAVHQASMGLLSGECELALAGGTHIRSPQFAGYQHHEGMILSPDGHCRAFDAKAQGTVLGSGVGVVVLKRLTDAVRDGDHVHAVIKGSAVNNDGAAKSGYTAPSVDGQATVIVEAHALAEVDPDSVTYVEAHGTGTPLGDPIELAALVKAFGPGLAQASCAIGSVKTNIGHLDAAAGVAGLIKATLMIEHGTLVPSLYFEALNPDIDLTGSPFHVNTETTDWASDGPRRAGVSSFGIGGTNAHVVLEEPPSPRHSAAAADRAELLLISARTPSAAEAAAEQLARHLRHHPELALADVAHTLAVGRHPHRHRRAVLCTGTVRAAAVAIAVGDGADTVAGVAEPAPQIGFAFGRATDDAATLYREEPAFAAALDAVAAQVGDTPAIDVLGAHDGRAAFIVQLALAELWRDWGVTPSATRGALGDLVSACLSDTMDVREACARAAALGQDPATTPEPDASVVSWVDLETCARGRGELLTAVAAVWVAGAEIDWTAVYAGTGAGRVPLPTYPFERTRHGAAIRRPQAEVRGPRLRARLAELSPGAGVDLLVEFVQQEVIQIFGEEARRPDPDQDVFELGFDSLILIDISAKLGAELGADVPASAFVENPTVRGFVQHLSSTLRLPAAAH